MAKRVTIIDIAAQAGVHFTTVGLALKGSPRVNAATRRKIQAIARKMGYVPDPMLSAFSAYRKAKKLPHYRETVALLTSHPTREGWKDGAGKVFHEGAEQRAAELGYRLEPFWFAEPGMGAKRATTVLSTRGIRGMLIAPPPSGHKPMNLDWKLFSSVALGFAMAKPRLHTVITTHYQDAIAAIRHLKAWGHHRLGWVDGGDLDETLAHQWKAGFWSETQALPAERQLPLFSHSPFDGRRFLAWFEKHRPDAVLTATPESCGRRIVECLEKAGYSVPGDVSVVAVHIQEETRFSGIKESSFQIAAAAVELLANLIRDGKTGLPHYPSRLLIEGKWIDGQTAARRAGATRPLTPPIPC